MIVVVVAVATTIPVVGSLGDVVVVNIVVTDVSPDPKPDPMVYISISYTGDFKGSM